MQFYVNTITKHGASCARFFPFAALSLCVIFIWHLVPLGQSCGRRAPSPLLLNANPLDSAPEPASHPPSIYMTVCDVIVPTMLCTRQSIPHGRRASERASVGRENRVLLLVEREPFFSIHTPRAAALDQSKQTPLAFHLPAHSSIYIKRNPSGGRFFIIRSACRPEGIFCMI